MLTSNSWCNRTKTSKRRVRVADFCGINSPALQRKSIKVKTPADVNFPPWTSSLLTWTMRRVSCVPDQLKQNKKTDDGLRVAEGAAGWSSAIVSDTSRWGIQTENIRGQSLDTEDGGETRSRAVRVCYCWNVGSGDKEVLRFMAGGGMMQTRKNIITHRVSGLVRQRVAAWFQCEDTYFSRLVPPFWSASEINSHQVPGKGKAEVCYSDRKPPMTV